MTQTIRIEVDAAGIALLTIDVPGRSMNVVSDEMHREFAAAVDRIKTDAAISGAIITSGKKAFLAGADLRKMLVVAERAKAAPAKQLLQEHSSFSQLLRRLETCGKPVVAAINGTALGGGFEICLACHARIAADAPGSQIGLPEVKVGLLPGAGGTQRVPRMVGIAAAMPLLLEGRSLSPQDAKQLGLVDAVVPPQELIGACRDWLRKSPSAVQSWDRPDFRMPGFVGLKSDEAASFFMAATASLQKKNWRNFPAPQAILRAVYGGTQVPIDAGLAIESRQFVRLLRDPVTAATIRTMFVNKQAADKLEARPASVPQSAVRSVGILGAGMMGQAIAYCAAVAGIDVVLLDRSEEYAASGKDYSRRLLQTAKRDAAESAQILDRILPTADYAKLARCDLVIEAVFEARDIKADVTRRAEATMPRTAIFASNTSTLPITGLAATFSRPQDFIGLHFFSPVDRMPLVEVILGKQTQDATLARTLDFVKQIRKTPIVVRDSRGFYTSRCFAVFPREGMTLLQEGVEPALIENAARMAGMPVGPLSVADEVSIELIYKVREQEKADLGAAYRPDPADATIDRFAVELGRIGRKANKGFYDYPPQDRKRLWPGLRDLYPPAAQQPSLQEVQKRIMYRQALEAVRCLEDGVIAKPADGDLGAILGWGFSAQTGGPFSMIDAIGVGEFCTECDRLAASYGPRFTVPPGLRAMAAAGRRFHPPA